MDWPNGKEVKVVITTEGSMRCGCRILPCNSVATVHPIEAWMPFFVSGARITLRNFRTAWCDEEVQIYLDEFSTFFPSASEKRGQLQVAELFAGLGGWSNAGREMGVQTAIFVEQCPMTAEACARTHNCGVMTANDYIQMLLENNAPEQAVLLADVESDVTWMALTMANVAYIMGSPPCQPWCGSGRTKGLLSDDGMVFQNTLTWGAKVEIRVMIIENVSNIAKHPDYKNLMMHAAMQGMQVVMADSHEIATCSPVRRDRWLATFVHSSVSLSDDQVARARSITLANDSFHVKSVSPSLSQIDGIHVNMSEQERNELRIDEDAMSKLGNPNFAPWWVTNQCKSLKPEDIFATRILKADRQLFAIMASYGGQHKLPEDLLSSKGLQTVIAEDEHGTRYFSPWEFAKALGYDLQTVLPTKMTSAWHMVGNGLSVLHAFIQIYKTHIALGEKSFVSLPEEIEKIFQKIHAKIGQLSNFQVVSEGEWCRLKQIEENPVKRARIETVIPATCPFLAEETILQTRTMVGHPEFAMDCDPKTKTNCLANGNGGLVMLAHCEKHWTMCVYGNKQTCVREVIQKAVQHAQGYDFLSFHMDQDELHWESKITSVPMKVLVFTPVKVQVTCREKK